MKGDKSKIFVEKLLDKSTGYLKIPQAIKDNFSTPKKWGNPDWRVIRNDDDVLEISYIFKKEEMKT